MSRKTTNNRALHRSRREPRGAAGDTSRPNFDLRDCGCAQPNATHLFMGTEDRPNPIAETGACIFGSTRPEGSGNGNRLKQPRQAEHSARPSGKVTYVICFLRGVEEKVIQENRGERWQIIELQKNKKPECKGVRIYERGARS